MALLCPFIGFVVPFYWLYYCTLIVFTMHQYVFDCSFDDNENNGYDNKNGELTDEQEKAKQEIEMKKALEVLMGIDFALFFEQTQK